jgi:hypothetical protein
LNLSLRSQASAAKERALGGAAGISISTFIEALQGMVNTTDVNKLDSTIKGRTKVSTLDLKKLLDAHWQTTTDWAAVSYGEAEQAGAPPSIIRRTRSNRPCDAVGTCHHPIPTSSERDSDKQSISITGTKPSNICCAGSGSPCAILSV